MVFAAAPGDEVASHAVIWEILEPVNVIPVMVVAGPGLFKESVKLEVDAAAAVAVTPP